MNADCERCIRIRELLSEKNIVEYIAGKEFKARKMPVQTAMCDVGLGAEGRSGGDQRLHSPAAWLPPGHEPGTGGVAQLPSSKKGALRA
jgi:hypothetical protein